LRELEERAAKDSAEYEVRKAMLDKLGKELRSHGPYWAIMERPMVAFEDKPYWASRVGAGGALGFGVGMLMALVIAFIAAQTATQEPAEV
jgi:hypothetical protein